ncbi:hypothetical protein EYF80_007670 [Liparis tanakae]|uniref:Uncharacterized protein n=1 Tax=Liparis tanakae TaxID=230148 RepID=A0A4Z2IWV0_9TELE|nr:hypothetical protein EYF80_007670 [Liparis tanakae]
MQTHQDSVSAGTRLELKQRRGKETLPAGWLADWVGGQEVEEGRPLVAPLLGCDQASLREQWPL